MKKGLLALFALLLMVSCVQPTEEVVSDPDYVGTWERILTTTNKQVIKIKKTSYKVTEVTFSAITGAENDPTELETGDITEVDSNTLEFVSTGIYALGDFQEVGPLSEANYTRNVTWVLNDDEITLIESTTIPTSYVAGTFTKQ
jgi:hypothetical protein